MKNYGFERIDVILAHLTEEMDATLEKQACKRDTRANVYNAPPPSDLDCVVDGTAWVHHKNLGELFDRMNARFEIVAKKLRHPERYLN